LLTKQLTGGPLVNVEKGGGAFIKSGGRMQPQFRVHYEANDGVAAAGAHPVRGHIVHGGRRFSRM
jgi:hypothetical protein